MLVVGVCLMLNSVLLWFSDTLGKQSKDLSCMSFKDALWVGVCQLFALMPGISRSGSTVTGMLFRDFQGVLANPFRSVAKNKMLYCV